MRCDKCSYVAGNHWILKRHLLTEHSTLEERQGSNEVKTGPDFAKTKFLRNEEQKHKYYCSTCDYVFFTQLFLERHLLGKHHLIKVEAFKTIDKMKEITI